MSLQFAASLPSEQTAIVEFLKTTFQADHELLSFRPDVFQWKYFSDHPDWHRDRSYVVKKEDGIVAHGGVWPLRLRRQEADVDVIHLIDWAASRAAVGSGLLLLKKLAVLTDVLLTIGGSSDTRSILTKIGYRRVGQLKLCARVIRPWLQFRNTRRFNWKAPLRLLRNARWSLTSLPRPPKNWEATRISQFDPSLESVLNRPATDVFTSQRTIAGLNRMLNCPAAAFSAFVLYRSKRPCGYFLLAQVGKQTRIVDLRVDRNDAATWMAACSLATLTAAEIPETAEIVAGFSLTGVNDAFGRAGFRSRGSLPVYCYDPKKMLGSEPVLDLSMLDGDLCFIADAQNPFWT
ncbi:MAG TPA: hypothetical protein VFF50_00515 [Candidatus Deferrimicrobiaceae bacterium]|nr:hypothetical protein [Candidatus Deferrimicrobiaceae bacterium]